MRCPHCSSENVYETKWNRNSTYVCRDCGRQFRDFQGNHGAALNINRFPSVVSRLAGDKKLTSVYVPGELLQKLNTALTGKAGGRSVARSPFIVAGIMLMMGLSWEEYAADTVALLRELSKSVKDTASRLRSLADELESK